MKLFPHETVRNVQSKMIADVESTIKERKHLIAQAPTGLGKTVASLTPALEFALQNGKSIIFLTPKHTQHQIVVETVKMINKKHGLKIKTVDFIGKQWMCPVPGITSLTSKDFSEYCKEIKKEERCHFHLKVRKNLKLTEQAKKVIKELQAEPALHVEELCKIVAKNEMCPYEITCELAKEANVIVADYYHLFHPNVRKAFLMKTNKELKDCIIIVDEAQNLPDRVREVLSTKISTFSLNSAVREAKKAKQEKLMELISELGIILAKMAEEKLKDKSEAYISRAEFIAAVNSITDYETFAGDLLLVGEQVRAEEKRSFIGSVGGFLQEWVNAEGDNYTRIIKKEKWKDKEYVQLLLKCLDPATSSRELFEECSSAILMSGTLTPTRMYRDILGLEEERTCCVEYENPFPSSNRLALIVPDTTTRYTRRNEEEYQKIAKWCHELSNTIHGNVAIFLPSYSFRDRILPMFERKSKKTIFVEQQGMTKTEKMNFLNEFKSYADAGAVFVGVTGGSFGEGIDLPGKFLQGVIVVGVPLDLPDLETQALIEYYEKLFSAGWNYGYVYPAMNRVVQACGRVIRSETDKGVVVLLDERFTWKNYFKCLPMDWKSIVTMNPLERIKKFYS